MTPQSQLNCSWLVIYLFIYLLFLGGGGLHNWFQMVKPLELLYELCITCPTQAPTYIHR